MCGSYLITWFKKISCFMFGQAITTNYAEKIKKLRLIPEEGVLNL